MADFPAYTRDELEQRARDLIRTRRRGADVQPRSDYDITSKILAALAWGMQMQGAVARQMLDCRQAFGTFLSQFMFEAGLGADITRVSAGSVRATGKIILLSDTGAQTQAAGSLLVHADGTQYTLDDAVTTASTATKALRAGDRSGRRRLFQGHTGAGFALPVLDEIYRFASTGEYCAIRGVDNASALLRYLFDLYNDLDADPQIQDLFSQQVGAVGSITAVNAGTLANKDPKDFLTLTSPSGTMQSTAYILNISGGEDGMSPSAMQAALRDILGVRTAPGTIDSIRQTALSYPDAPLHECYVVPATHGLGTYTLLPVHEDGQFIVSDMLEDIVDYASARISPVDKIYGSAVYETLDTAIDYLDVECSEIYAPDWTLPDGTVRGIPITAATSSALTLGAVTGAAPGDRVLVCNAGPSGPYVVQRRVNSVAGFSIGLDEALPFPPDAHRYVARGEVSIQCTSTNPFLPGMAVFVGGNRYLALDIESISLGGPIFANITLVGDPRTTTTGWAVASGPVTVSVPGVPAAAYSASANTTGIVVTIEPAAYVTPGGPLGDTIIDAIHAAYEARAPSVGYLGSQVRLPISVVSDDPQSIVAAVSLVEGVVDAECRLGDPPFLIDPGGVLLPGYPIRMYSEA